MNTSRWGIRTLMAILVVPGCLACGTEPEPAPLSLARLQVVSGESSFGEVRAGEARTIFLELVNAGDAPAWVTGVSGPEPEGQLTGLFSADVDDGKVAPGSVIKVPVTFAAPNPRESGAWTLPIQQMPAVHWRDAVQVRSSHSPGHLVAGVPSAQPAPGSSGPCRNHAGKSRRNSSENPPRSSGLCARPRLFEQTRVI